MSKTLESKAITISEILKATDTVLSDKEQEYWREKLNEKLVPLIEAQTRQDKIDKVSKILDEIPKFEMHIFSNDESTWSQDNHVEIEKGLERLREALKSE